jgi:hypothetical protein
MNAFILDLAKLDAVKRVLDEAAMVAEDEKGDVDTAEWLTDLALHIKGVIEYFEKVVDKRR